MSACTQTPFPPENWSKPMSRRGRPSLCEAELIRTVSLYREMGTSGAAEALGLTKAGVRRRLHQAGVKPDDRPGPRPNDKRKPKDNAPVSEIDMTILALRRSGKTQQQIAHEFGVSRQRIHQRLSRAEMKVGGNAVWSPADIYSPEA